MTAFVQIPVATLLVFVFLLAVLGLSLVPNLIASGEHHNGSAVSATRQLPGGNWPPPLPVPVR